MVFTNVIRDKDGKLITTWENLDNSIPNEVASRFYNNGVLKSEYTQNTYQRKNERKGYLSGSDPYSAQIEMENNRVAFLQNINKIEAQRDQAVAQANLTKRNLSKTRDNPFVTSGGRELTRRRTKLAYQNLTNSQKDLEDAVSFYNDVLLFEPIPPNKDPMAEAKAAQEARLLAEQPPGEPTGEPGVYRTASKSFVPSKKEKEKLDIENYRNRNTQQQSGGITLTVPKLDRPLSKSETQEYNKTLINAQLDARKSLTLEQRKLLDRGQLSIGLTFEEKKVEPTKVSSNTPLASAKFIPPKNTEQSYLITDKNGNQQRQSNLSDAEIRAYQKIGSKVVIETAPTKYRVTSPDGKERIFNTKEAADKFRNSYGDNREVEGPVRPSGISGSLVNVFGVKPEAQGPNLNERAFFVGANAQGYTIDTTKKIEPTVTTSDIFGSNWLTRRWDTIYELNKPVSERNDENRMNKFFTNREIGELTAYGVNRAIEIKDFFTKEKGLDKELGNPFAKFEVRNPTPRIETTLDKLIQGKPVDWSDKNTRFSAYGSILGFAGELVALDKGFKGGIKAAESGALYQKTGAFTKAGAVKKAESLLSEGLISGSTKINDDYYIIARGGGGKGSGISTKIEPSISIEKVNDKITARFSNVPKDINTLQSGEKIAQQVEKINKEIEKLRVFTNRNKFNDELVQKTQDKIKLLENKRDALQNTPSLTTGEARYPVSIIEFGNAPKVTQIGKAQPITQDKPGTTIFVEGTVPRQQVLEFGFTELPKMASKEFGILTKPGQTNAVYQGVITESNLPKLIEAEKLGYIRTLAEGKTAPLNALLKGRTDVLREYAGIKTVTTKIIGEKESKNIFDIFKRTPKKPQKIEPEISLFSKTKPDEIRTPTEFGIVNKGNIRSGESRGVTGIGSKSLDNFAQDMLKPMVEKTVAKKKPFNFGMGESKGTAGSAGKGASLSMDDAFGAAKSYIQSKPIEPQDILFSPPRGLLPQAHGVLSDSVMVYPERTPERIKNQFRIDTGLETNSRQKTLQSGEGDYFKRFELEMSRQTKKEFEKQEEINIFIQTPKESQGLKGGIISITGLGQVPIQSTGLDQTPIQGLKTKPVLDTVTDLITDPFPTTGDPITGSGFNLGIYGGAFPGFGGGGDNRYRRKKGKKKYIVSSIDPFTPGSIETAGVKQQQVSRSKSIYGKIDVDLGKARKKNQPREKRRKDPFKL